MDSHPLVKLAHMLHGVCFAVINGEGWLLESSRECSPFYMACEMWFRELIQCPTHGIVSQGPGRRAFAFAPLVMLFLMREGLTWGGSKSLPIVIIVFIIVRHVRARMRLPSLCMAQFSLQVVYLSLQGLFILPSLGYVAAHTRMAYASWVVFTLPFRNLSFSSFQSRSGFGKLPCCWDLAGSGWWEPALWGPNPTMLDCCPY